MSDDHPKPGSSRRDFIKKTASVAVGAGFLASGRPARARTADDLVIGEGDYQYAVDHNWAKLPEGKQFGYTHGVVEDRQGRIYIANQSPDAIAVFDADGKFLSSWGAPYEAGAHGLTIFDEDGTEVLYLANTSLAEVVKTTLDGDVLWQRGVPDLPDVYSEENRYSPTETAVAPDGTVYVADGYGQSWIHVYEKDGTYRTLFGGKKDDESGIDSPHGITIVERDGEPVVEISDRNHVRVVHFSLDGEYLGEVISRDALRFPCTTVHAGGLTYIPDLFARVSIFDGAGQKLVDLGDYVDGQPLTSWDDFGKTYPALEGYPNLPHEKRTAGKFISPHSLWVDGSSNIYVVEWIEDGRVTKLVRQRRVRGEG